MLYELFGMLLSSPDLGPRLKKHVSVTETAKTSAEIRSILVSLLWLLLGCSVLSGCFLAARAAPAGLRTTLPMTPTMSAHLGQLERPGVSHHEFSKHRRVFGATQKDLKSRTEHLKAKSLR